MPSCGIGLGLPYAGTGIDPDALSYFSRAGISSAAVTPTTFQNASTFSGTPQSLTVTSNSTLQVGGSSFSFSCWFNPSVASGPQTLIQKTASGALEYSFGIGGAGQVRGLIGNAGSSWAVINDSPFNPSAGRWTQAVWTYDGTTLRIYINGSLSSSASGPAITTSGTAPLEIGRETGAAFNGSISSVGFWKRAISASEVTALFNSGSGRTYASLDSSIRTNMVSWWDLSETSGNRADSFGSNTLTNNNSVGTTSQGVIVTGTANSRALILDFVKGVKDLGLWNNFVCWPLRSSQNAGTGTTAFSLGGLGTFNGTLVNGPTWGADGIQVGGTGLSARVTVPISIRTFINNGASIYGVLSNAAEDNFVVFQCADGSDGNPTYPSLTANQVNNTGVVPCVTRNGSRYFQSTRGGAFPAGFSSIAGVIRPTSQANYRNATLIANESGLAAMNPDSQVTVDSAYICGRGNGAITGGGVISPFSLVSSQTYTGTQLTQLNSLYKSTLGVGLGLP